MLSPFLTTMTMMMMAMMTRAEGVSDRMVRYFAMVYNERTSVIEWERDRRHNIDIGSMRHTDHADGSWSPMVTTYQWYHTTTGRGYSCLVL